MVPVTLYFVVTFTKLYPDMPVVMCEIGIGNKAVSIVFLHIIFFIVLPNFVWRWSTSKENNECCLKLFSETIK